MRGGARPIWGSPGAMWAVPTLLFLVAFFHRVAPGVLARDLMEAFGAGASMLGLLSATYFYGYAGAMIPAGVLIDGLGPRRVVAVGGALMGLGTLAMAAAPGPGLLFAGRLCIGIGGTATFVGALKVAATRFPSGRFGTFAALTATAGVVGSLLATVPLARLTAAVGWRAALAGVGALTLGLALLALVIVRDGAPAATGPQLGDLAGRQLGGVALRGADAAGPPWREVVRGMVAVLANRHTWPPFLAFFCLYAAAGNFMLWIVPCLRDVYAVSTPEAAWYASAWALALLPAAPLTGWVSDRVLRRRKLPYTVLALAQLALWLALAWGLGRLPLGGIWALLFVLGLVGGAFVLTWPIGREVNPPALAGVAVAVVNLGGFAGAALTQAPLGMLLDAYWSGALAGGVRVYPQAAYRTLFAACALFGLGAAVLSLLVRETRGENIHAALAAERLARRAAP